MGLLVERDERLVTMRAMGDWDISLQRELEAEVAALEAEVEECERVHREAEQALARASDELDNLRNRHHTAALAVANHEKDLERTRERVKAIGEAQEGRVAERSELLAEVEALGSRGTGGQAFDEFRRMEDQIEGVETAFAAQREVDEALGGGRGPGGLTREEVEAKFRALEYGTAGDKNGSRSEVDDELKALKKKIRIDTR